MAKDVQLICRSQVAKENKTTLPSAGLFIIRYHSFYRKFGNNTFTCNPMAWFINLIPFILSSAQAWSVSVLDE